MNTVYKKVLSKMEAVDPALGKAILDQGLKTVGCTPDDVTPQEMREVYEEHLKGVLKKYPESREVKAVFNIIQSMTSEDFAGVDEAKIAALKAEKLPDGHITETLYSQPTAEEPNLILGKLKEGVYEAGSAWGLSTVLRFTNVGGAFWDILKRGSPKTILKLEDYSQLEDYKAWEISINAKDLSISLKSIRYRPFANFPAAFYIECRLDGESKMACKVVRGVVDAIGYVPYNMNDWTAFEKKTQVTENTVKKNWGKFL
jgi:hypothetical protein